MRRIQISEILEYLESEGIKFKFYGNKRDFIRRISNLNCIEDESICWIKNERYLSKEIQDSIRGHNNLLVITSFKVGDANTIIVDSPKDVFFPIINYYFPTSFKHCISEDAVVLTDKIGNNVHIGSGCNIGKDVEIGSNTIIHPNVVVECPCRIGRDCEIYSGVAIGTDGFGYYVDEEGVPHKETHYGGVKIGNSVEIGANTCIDRGLLSDTIIEDNVKIDNLVHIAHNVHISESSMIIAGAIVCGSTELGERCYVAPGGIIKNQLKIGVNAFVGLGAVVTQSVESDTVVAGVPAKKIRKVKNIDK